MDGESDPRPSALAGEPPRALRAGLRGLSREERWGWAVSALGILVILWGVLHLTTATIGGRVREFKHRRTYTEVKTAAHEALPWTLALGLAGLGILALGARLRRAGRRSDRDD